jgi:hypothetical protein
VLETGQLINFSQLPYEHFRKAHSFGLNTAVSMIHYPPIPAQHRQKATQTDVRSGGESLAQQSESKLINISWQNTKTGAL